MQLRFGHYFRILHSCTDQSINSALAALDLTRAQGHIMGYLAHCKTPPCARDIEQAFRLSHPTVSGLLSRLEKKNFIEFRPDEADRRCKRIHLLPKGEELLSTMYQIILDTDEKLTRNFTPEEREQFIVFLNRAVQNVSPDCKRKPKEETSQ